MHSFVTITINSIKGICKFNPIKQPIHFKYQKNITLPYNRKMRLTICNNLCKNNRILISDLRVIPINTTEIYFGILAQTDLDFYQSGIAPVRKMT